MRGKVKVISKRIVIIRKMKTGERCSTNFTVQKRIKRLEYSWRERLARDARIVPSIARASPG